LGFVSNPDWIDGRRSGFGMKVWGRNREFPPQQ
jgi:hypothetical protein